MRKKITAFFLAMLIMTLVSSCGKREKEGSYTYHIYYVNKEGTHVTSKEYVTDTSAKDMDKLLQELMEQMTDTSEKPEYISPLSAYFQNYTLNGGQMNLDFGIEYAHQDPLVEVLCRAAVVRTLTQIKGIDTITFSVQGNTLTDAVGMPVGAMTADSFIDNAGTVINAYVENEFRLYFANVAGDALLEVHRNVVYNGNISTEQQVVEELIKGPMRDDQIEKEAYPTINPAVKILSVTLKDRVCYVNLSKDFLTSTYQINSQVALYSIVNSLVELSGVNKVQISIEGDTNVTFRDSVSLTTIFERNLDIVEKK